MEPSFNFLKKSVDRLITQRQYTNTEKRIDELGVDFVTPFAEISGIPNPDIFMKCRENGHIFSMKYCAIANKTSQVANKKKTHMCDACVVFVSNEETRVKAKCAEIGIEFISYSLATRKVVYVCGCGRARTVDASGIHKKERPQCNACQNIHRHPPKFVDETERELRARYNETRRVHRASLSTDRQRQANLKSLDEKNRQETARIIEQLEWEMYCQHEREKRQKEHAEKVSAILKERSEAEEIRARDFFDYVESVFADSGCTLLSKSCGKYLELLDYICECGCEAKICLSEFLRGRRCINCSHRRGMATAFRNRKEVVSPTGKSWSVMGYEDRYLRHAIESGISDENLEAGLSEKIPICRYNYERKNRRWYPDAWIVNEQKIIEVKSTWTYSLTAEMMKAKMLHCPYNCELWIYSDTDIAEMISFDYKTKTFNYLRGNLFEIGEPFPGIKVPDHATYSKISNQKRAEREATRAEKKSKKTVATKP